MAKPIPGTFPPYLGNYINLVNEDELLLAFKAQHIIAGDFFASISNERSMFAYSPGKWSIKEMLQHIIDTERIFNYRALAISRKELASLPGFDEDNYAINSSANRRMWETMIDEFRVVRKSTEMLYESFTTEMLEHSGNANGKSIVVKALGFATIGHLYHHVNVIKERYL